MPDLSYGAAQFRDLSRRLAAAGEGDLTRELRSALRKASRPAMDSVRTGLPRYMPEHYAVDALEPDLVLSASLAPTRVASVQIKATTRIRRRSIRRLEEGVLAHPLFGNRKGRWYYQADGVRAGFFTGPLTDSRPLMQRAILDAMVAVAAKITGR